MEDREIAVTTGDKSEAILGATNQLAVDMPVAFRTVRFPIVRHQMVDDNDGTFILVDELPCMYDRRVTLMPGRYGDTLVILVPFQQLSIRSVRNLLAIYLNTVPGLRGPMPAVLLIIGTIVRCTTRINDPVMSVSYHIKCEALGHTVARLVNSMVEHRVEGFRPLP